MFFLIFCFVVATSAVVLDENQLDFLTDLFVALDMLPSAPANAADVAEWKAEGVGIPDVECPAQFRSWSCNATGAITELTLRPRPRAPRVRTSQSKSAWSQIRPRVGSLLIEDFYGQSYTSFTARRIVVRNSVFWQQILPNAVVSDISFPFLTNDLELVNVSLPNLAMLETDFHTPLLSCSFVNVTLRCPVPSWLWPCFNSTTQPPCLTTPLQSPPGAEHQLCEIPSGPCHIDCTPPPAPGFQCDNFYADGAASTFRGYFPSVPGPVVLDVFFSRVGFAEKFFLRTAGVAGNVLRLELLDWMTLNWTRVFDNPAPQRVLATNDDFFPTTAIATNRARVTLELTKSATEAILEIYLFRSWPRPPRLTFLPPECDSVATSFGARSMLDETMADSWCIGRACYEACKRYAADFTFARAVKAQFLVIQGGELWQQGALVATPSSGTRVYRLDGNETDKVLVAGVGKPRRVRLVGDPVAGSLPAPTLPNRLGMPGVFVKTFAAAAPSGGAVVGVALANAPNGTVSAVRVRDTAFATTSDGSLWQAVGNASWTAISPAVLTPFVADEAVSAPVRLLAAVADRLLVVVLSSSKIHDGSRLPLLVNRKLVQAALDVFDVKRGVWFSNILQHDIERNSSDVDIVQLNATAFAVVERTTRAASIFVFRPFPYNLTSSDLLDVGYLTRAPVFLSVDVPPGSVVRVEATANAVDDTIYVSANGPDDTVVSLTDGSAPGQIFLSVRSPMATLAPGQSFAPTSTLAGGGFTITDTAPGGGSTDSSDGGVKPPTGAAGSTNSSDGGVNEPTTTGAPVDGSTSSGSRLTAPLAVLSAAIGCWFEGAAAAVACPVVVTVKISPYSASRIRFTGLSAGSQLVCSLGSRRTLPTGVTDVTFGSNALDWAPSASGYCLVTSVYKKTDTFTSSCSISMADTVTATQSPSAIIKLYINGQLSSALEYVYISNPGRSGIAFTAPGVDGLLTTFSQSLSNARAVVNVTKTVGTSATTCEFLYTCMAGACLDGFTDDPTSFCGKFDTQPASPPPVVTVCSNMSSNASATLQACRYKCGGMVGDECDANIRGTCCGSNVACFSDTKTPPLINCSQSWGTDCKSIGCALLCNVKTGCPTSGSCPSSNAVCARRCTCFPPYCSGAFQGTGAVGSATHASVAALAAILAVVVALL